MIQTVKELSGRKGDRKMNFRIDVNFHTIVNFRNYSKLSKERFLLVLIIYLLPTLLGLFNFINLVNLAVFHEAVTLYC